MSEDLEVIAPGGNQQVAASAGVVGRNLARRVLEDLGVSQDTVCNTLSYVDDDGVAEPPPAQVVMRSLAEPDIQDLDRHLLFGRLMRMLGERDRKIEALEEELATSRLKFTPRAQTEEVIITFQPGAIGITHLGNKVTGIKEGSQAQREGVELGWKLLSVRDQTCEDFDDPLFLDAHAGSTSYQVTFEKDREGTELLAPLPPERSGYAGRRRSESPVCWRNRQLHCDESTEDKITRERHRKLRNHGIPRTSALSGKSESPSPIRSSGEQPVAMLSPKGLRSGQQHKVNGSPLATNLSFESSFFSSSAADTSFVVSSSPPRYVDDETHAISVSVSPSLSAVPSTIAVARSPSSSGVTVTRRLLASTTAKSPSIDRGGVVPQSSTTPSMTKVPQPPSNYGIAVGMPSFASNRASSLSPSRSQPHTARVETARSSTPTYSTQSTSTHRLGSQAARSCDAPDARICGMRARSVALATSSNQSDRQRVASVSPVRTSGAIPFGNQPATTATIAPVRSEPRSLEKDKTAMYTLQSPCISRACGSLTSPVGVHVCQPRQLPGARQRSVSPLNPKRSVSPLVSAAQNSRFHLQPLLTARPAERFQSFDGQLKTSRVAMALVEKYQHVDSLCKLGNSDTTIRSTYREC